MKLLGNIIWVLFGGLFIALYYFVVGLLLLKNLKLELPYDPQFHCYVHIPRKRKH